MTTTEQTPQIGQRVRLRRDVDRYPHFVAPAGSVGTVEDVSYGAISVVMDDVIPGAEEWDNEVVWDDSESGRFWGDCESLA